MVADFVHSSKSKAFHSTFFEKSTISSTFGNTEDPVCDVLSMNDPYVKYGSVIKVKGKIWFTLRKNWHFCTMDWFRYPLIMLVIALSKNGNANCTNSEK